MIVGIGIDSVDIQRFVHWNKMPVQRLRRLFSAEEIAYCMADSFLYAERFAARFAAREAFFKALSAAIEPKTIFLLHACKGVTISNASNGRPVLIVDGNFLSRFAALDYHQFIYHLSLTHTDTVATAFVVIEKRCY